VNPENPRRFEEAYDLIMTAWTEPVWSHEGKFFQLRDCAIWPPCGSRIRQYGSPRARSGPSNGASSGVFLAPVYQTTGQIEDTFGYYRTRKEDGWEAKRTNSFSAGISTRRDRSKSARFAEPAMRYFSPS
jgi:alkanesulfonate monooxygenase SsuD/methylene tetrahydromethanopterin reductase-like flavin-dependent oxidoreductase (luciferase family)